MDFGDMKDDKIIQEKIVDFHNSVNNIERTLAIALNAGVDDKLSAKEKADFDLFMAYSLNTLYWLYLKTKGADPNQSDVKNQLNRVKEYMMKAKQAYERSTIRPRIDQGAAKRFIKHSIQKPENDGESPPKKVKLS